MTKPMETVGRQKKYVSGRPLASFRETTCPVEKEVLPVFPARLGKVPLSRSPCGGEWADIRAILLAE